jgi:hypothetical protein
MNDLLSIARRLSEYAEKPDKGAQEREDLRNAADALRSMNIMLNAKPAVRPC